MILLTWIKTFIRGLHTRRYKKNLLCVAVSGSIITLALLHEPWYSSRGPGGGKIQVNGLGRVTLITSLPGLWSSSPPRMPDIGGAWGIGVGVAATITVAGYGMYIKTRNETLSHLVTVSIIATAVCAVRNLIYINGKKSELQAALAAGPVETGTQVGMIVRAFSHNGSYAVPGLVAWTWGIPAVTATGMVAIVTAAVAATMAATPWLADVPLSPPAARNDTDATPTP